MARVVATIALLLSVGAVPAVHPFAASVIPASPATARSAGPTGCNLGPNGAVKHVIFIEFDNTHFMRDPARNGSHNVPSDLEQMPNLLNFLKGNGTVLTNYHMPLISHTSDDITASESGLYPSNNGIANSANSYYEYTSPGSPARQTGFTYWTSKTKDGTYNFLGANGQNAPAPWVPYTRAGCNVGGVAMSGLAFENSTDVNQTFGMSSTQASDKNQFADYYGVAVHCAASDPLCSNANGGAADALPNEPGGYSGYNALFGHKSITQALTTTGQISSTAALTDINGNPIVNDNQGITITNGFPGFSIAPQYSLGYVADLQEHGVPVTYAYIITPHRPLGTNPYGYGFPNDTNDYGPGEAHYVAQLKQYDQAFGSFFQRLNSDGINKSNTEFVFTTDEGDHFIGETPFPANCDGVSVPCTYPPTPPSTTPGITTSLGELTLNFTGLLQGETGISTPVTINNDDAPDFYLNGKPGPTDSTARAFERGTAALTVTNPLSTALGIASTENLAQYQADPAEFKILHMQTADPLRTPTFVTFAQPDYYVQFGSCSGQPVSITCVTQNPSYNWNHGDVQPEITTGWLGLVGPGVQQNGLDAATFADHTDTRPTMLSLLGLADDYTDDGRVLTEDLSTIPPAVQADRDTYEALARTFKALNAPVGPFGLATLVTSTQALASGSAGDDSTYTADEAQLTSLGQQRDNLVGQMQTILASAAFTPTYTIDDAQAQSLIAQGQTLLAQTTSTSTTILGPVFVPVTTTTTTLTPTYPLSTSLLSLAFPPASVPATTAGITVTGYSITPTIAFQDPTSTTVGLGDQVQFTATSALTGGNVTTFSAPITITMAYSPTALPANASGPAAIYYYDTTTGAYTQLPNSQDNGTGTVTATTNHFSAYQVRVPVTPAGGTPQPTQSSTNTPTSTNTATPTTGTSTATPTTGTSTAVASTSDTATSTATSATVTATTGAGTATNTAVPATATSTATSSATNTPTNTNTATNTPTNTATNTSVASTATRTTAPTQTPPNTPAPTATPYPTIIIVTPPAGTATPRPTPRGCNVSFLVLKGTSGHPARPALAVNRLRNVRGEGSPAVSRTPLFFADGRGVTFHSNRSYRLLICGVVTLVDVQGTIHDGSANVGSRRHSVHINLRGASFELRVKRAPQRGHARRGHVPPPTYNVQVRISGPNRAHRYSLYLAYAGLRGSFDIRR